MAKKTARKIDLLETLQVIQQVGIDLEGRELWLTPVYHAPDDHSVADVERNMAISFVKSLRLLNAVSQEPIVLHMLCSGGNYIDGMAIFDAIRNSESPTILIVYGEASSASGFILQAADLRVMMPNSHLMIHSGSIGVEGPMEQVEAAVKWATLQTDIMVTVFEKRAKISREEIVKEMHGRDWYLLPQEAVDKGFADVVLGVPGFETISMVKTRKVEKA